MNRERVREIAGSVRVAMTPQMTLGAYRNDIESAILQALREFSEHLCDQARYGDLGVEDILAALAELEKK